MRVGVGAGECVWVFLGEGAGVSVSVGKEVRVWEGRQGGFGRAGRESALFLAMCFSFCCCGYCCN